VNILAVILAATAPMATRQAATNIAEHVVASATPGIVAAAVAAVPAPDYSTANTQLVATIEAAAPAPGNYAAVSNAAMTALHSEVDPTVPAWAKAASAPLPGNYATVSNRAMSALQSYTETDPTVPSWAKAETKPTYTTNEISGLTTALSGKLDKTGGTMTGSVQFNSGWTAMGDMSDTVSVGQDAGDGYVGIGETKYRRTGIRTSYGNLYFPADSGTFALTSDIPAVDLTAATNYTDSAIGAAIAPANPTFSNAVLAVGLNIDTNAVAALNEIAADFGGFPLTPGSTATTVGGILAALAAAVAWLKKNKANSATTLAGYGITDAHITNGVVTLGANSITPLTSHQEMRYPFAATIQPTAGTAAPTGTLTDRAGNKVVCTEATGQTGDNAKLTLTLPPAVSGYMRDFLVKIDRTTSGCYTVDFVPYGNESISYETEDGSMPEVPDGAVTWLSFTESESGGVFVVRAIPLVAVTGGS